MKPLYSRIHELEEIHIIKNYLNIEELIIPSELRRLCNTQRYEEKLDTFYKTLGNVLIIEPHSSRSNIKEDYYVYISGNEEMIANSFLFYGNGKVITGLSDTKRIILEVILKPNNDSVNKIINYALTINQLIKNVTKNNL